MPLLLLIYIPPVVLFLILGIISITKDISPSLFIVDPAAKMDFEPYIGLVSNLGIVLWASSMAICFFTFAILRMIKKTKRVSNFLLFSGIFTLILMLDDLFMIHELVKHYSSEYIVFTVYLVIMLLILIKFRDIIFKTDYILISLALIFFGLSLVIDALYNFNFLEGVRYWDGIRLFLEDGFKFAGIISWLTYFAKVGITSINNPRLVSQVEEQ